MAIVAFAGNARVRAYLNSPIAHSVSRVQHLLDLMKTEKLGSRTRTDKALKLVFSDVLSGAKGDRQKSPDVIVVFTDGGLHHTATPYSEVIPKVRDSFAVALFFLFIHLTPVEF